jgi:YD repeat-containing protein
MYGLRLTSTTDQGTSTTSRNVIVSGALKLGTFATNAVDLNLPAPGFAVKVERRYDSRDPRSSDFGFGWTLGVNDVRIETSGLLGDSWIMNEMFSGFITSFCLEPAEMKSLTITVDDRHSYRFDVSADIGNGSECQELIPPQFGNLVFGPAVGTNASLVSLDPLSFAALPVDGSGIVVQLLNDSTFDVLQPRRYQLTTGDGLVYVLSIDSGLASVTDRHGDALQLGATELTSSSGRSAALARDASGRITRITDPDGHAMFYTYDASGNLASFVDRAGGVTSYSYDAGHRLLAIVNPDGSVRHLTYDAIGRLVSDTAASGGTTSYAWLLAPYTEIATVGGATTTTTFDPRGDALAVVDPTGGVSHYTYDAVGNQLSATDPAGNVTTMTYDAAGRLTSSTDPLGQLTIWVYDMFGDLVKILVQGAALTTNTYDAAGDLLSTTDPSGATTSHTYDARGLVLSTTSPAGVTTTYTYDALGDLLSATDPSSGTTTFTYDANGNRLTSSDPTGTTTHYVYNALDQLVQTILP